MAMKICEACGKKFETNTLKQKYCSHKCATTAYRIKKRSEIFRQVFNKEKYTCRWCGKQFDSSTPAEYCSADCRKAHRANRKTSNKKNMKEIVRINELARKEGLTYGQYLARHGYGNVGAK